MSVPSSGPGGGTNNGHGPAGTVVITATPIAITAATNVRLVVTKSEAEQIIDEVQAHPREFKKPLTVLLNTFVKNQTNPKLSHSSFSPCRVLFLAPPAELHERFAKKIEAAINSEKMKEVVATIPKMPAKLVSIHKRIRFRS
jgi:hypothetical protein